jgi:putative ABC transport system permease protein
MAGSWIEDGRSALRLFLRRPSLVVFVTLTLGLGVGVNTSVFSLVYTLLIRDLPYRDPARIVRALPASSSGPLADTFGGPGLVAWSAQTRAFAALAGYGREDLTLATDHESVQLSGAKVSPTFFDVFGVSPLLGRTLRDGEARPDPRTAVIGYTVWARYFGLRPDIVGRSLVLEGETYQIVGVMPESFAFPAANVAFWIPLQPGLIRETYADGRPRIGIPQVRLVGRLRDGVTLGQASVEARSAISADRGGAILVPLQDDVVRGLRPGLLMLQGTVALVLAIACANVANLLLAVGASRRKEFALRLAIGASRVRLMRQVVVEGAILGASGGAAGLLFAWWTLDLLKSSSPVGLPQSGTVGVSVPVVMFASGVALTSGIVAAVLPAWRSTRVELTEGMRMLGGATTFTATGRRRLVTSKLLVSAEICLALVMLASAIVLVRGFLDVLYRTPGYAAGDVVTVDISLPPKKYSDIGSRQLVYQQLLERISRIPGVSRAALTTRLPLGPGNGYFDITPPEMNRGSFSIDAHSVITRHVTVSREYFEALQIPVLRGRPFGTSDTRSSLPVAVISAAVAQRDFGGEGAVGKSVQYARREWHIVGVAGDVRENPFEDQAVPLIYLPYEQLGYPEEMWGTQLLNVSLALKALPGRDSQALSGARLETLSVEPMAALSGLTTMQERLYRSIGSVNFYAALMTGLALVALALAAIGVASLLAYSISQRAKEFAIRMTLGATPGMIFSQIVRDGLAMSATGLLLGVPASWVIGHVLRASINGVRPLSGLSLLVGVGVLLGVAFIASAVPARRAARIEPLTALHQD